MEAATHITPEDFDRDADSREHIRRDALDALNAELAQRQSALSRWYETQYTEINDTFDDGGLRCPCEQLDTFDWEMCPMHNPDLVS